MRLFGSLGNFISNGPVGQQAPPAITRTLRLFTRTLCLCKIFPQLVMNVCCTAPVPHRPMATVPHLAISVCDPMQKNEKRNSIGCQFSSDDMSLAQSLKGQVKYSHRDQVACEQVIRMADFKSSASYRPELRKGSCHNWSPCLGPHWY